MVSLVSSLFKVVKSIKLIAFNNQPILLSPVIVSAKYIICRKLLYIAGSLMYTSKNFNQAKE